MSTPKKPLSEIQKLRHEMQLMIQKITVATEMMHYCRITNYRNAGVVAQNIIDAFDKEDNYWQSLQQKVVFDLIEIFDKPVREVLNDIRSDADPVFHLAASTHARGKAND